MEMVAYMSRNTDWYDSFEPNEAVSNEKTQKTCLEAIKEEQLEIGTAKLQSATGATKRKSAEEKTSRDALLYTFLNW